MDRPSRNYIHRTGGGHDSDDMWYEEDVITLYEGDTCPQCNKGKLKVSRANKLYCSKLCWLPPDPNPSNESYPDPAQFNE